MAREQRLVGGDHGAANTKRGLDRALGGIALPAHQLHKHVEAIGARELDWAVDLAHTRKVERRILGRILGGISHQLDRTPGALGQLGARAHDHGRHGGTDRA